MAKTVLAADMSTISNSARKISYAHLTLYVIIRRDKFCCKYNKSSDGKHGDTLKRTSTEFGRPNFEDYIERTR